MIKALGITGRKSCAAGDSHCHVRVDTTLRRCMLRHVRHKQGHTNVHRPHAAPQQHPQSASHYQHDRRAGNAAQGKIPQRPEEGSRLLQRHVARRLVGIIGIAAGHRAAGQRADRLRRERLRRRNTAPAGNASGSGTGTTVTAAQAGQRACRPAVSSPVRSILPQAEQENSMGMSQVLSRKAGGRSQLLRES